MSLSLAIIGTTNHELMEFSLDKTLKTIDKIDKDQIFVFSNKKIRCNHSYKYIELNDKFDLCSYTIFCLKELHKFIETDHVMTIQYDGFPTKGKYWNDDYLKYDCIGPLVATMNPAVSNWFSQIDDPRAKTDGVINRWLVGGGGFCIKSKKFLNAFANKEFLEYVPLKDGGCWYCEDLSYAWYYKEKLENDYDIKFAPIDLAMNFAMEIATGYGYSMGFHGWTNAPYFLNENEMIFFIQNLNRKDFNKESPAVNTLLGNLIINHQFRAVEALNKILQSK